MINSLLNTYYCDYKMFNILVYISPLLYNYNIPYEVSENSFL